MAEEQVNPFEVQPQQKPFSMQVPQASQWATIAPQGEGGAESGYFQQVDPAVMQMMWAPQQQLVPQQQKQSEVPPPQINPLV